MCFDPITLSHPADFLNDLNVSLLSSMSSDLVKIIILLYHRKSPPFKVEREGKIRLEDLLFSRDAIPFLCSCIDIHRERCRICHQWQKS